MDWKERSLAEELSGGMELARQLKVLLDSSSTSSVECLQLVQGIMSSSENALLILNRSEQPQSLAPVSSVPDSCISEFFDEKFWGPDAQRSIPKKRKLTPTWTEQVSSDNGYEGVVNDGYSWRKYGQKDILCSKYPRSYYRCASKFTQNCLARKHVQRSDDDPTVFEVIYFGKHNCNQVTTSYKKQELLMKQISESQQPNSPQPEQQNSDFQCSIKTNSTVDTEEAENWEMSSPLSFSSRLSFYGPQMWAKLIADPVTSMYLQQPDFLCLLQDIQKNPNALNLYVKDQRITPVLGMLPNIKSSTNPVAISVMVKPGSLSKRKRPIEVEPVKQKQSEPERMEVPEEVPDFKLTSSPSLFFKALKVLDLSYTSIRTVPPSISTLVSLEKLHLRCCELLVELPHEIGELSNLLVLDLEGTELMYLPKEIEKLTSIEQLKVSFYGYGGRFREGKGINTIYPKGALSKLSNLKELSINVNPDENQWKDDVEAIMNDLQKIEFLSNFELYFPSVDLLGQLYSSSFKFIVGQHEQRLISRIPHEVEERFRKEDKSLRYINGEGISTEVVSVLKRTCSFFLDRHWSIKKLSEFGNANLSQLKLCLISECNELETIIDENNSYEENDELGTIIDENNSYKLELYFNEALNSLEHLALCYLKSLTSICRGPLGFGTLSKLKLLNIHTCTNLTHVFTFELLAQLVNLEEIILEDCPKIKSLVSEESYSTRCGNFLLNLKKLFLLELPDLVSITNGVSVAPKLEKLVVFYCPNLENISAQELSCKQLKILKGESEWWESLTWNNWDIGDQDDLTNTFVPLRRDGNLKAQFMQDD